MKIRIDDNNCGFFTYKGYTNSTYFNIYSKERYFERIFVLQTIKIIYLIRL